jgi:hypothetical protein
MRLFKDGTDFAEKVQLGASLLIRLAILVAIIGEIFNRRYALLFATFLAFALTFIPSFIEKNYKVVLPTEFEFIIVLFIYASLFLGDYKGYYTRFWWWDAVLHAGSGIILGFVGFLILYILYKENKINANPSWIVIFSFSFAVAFGAVWEIFEFSIDGFFGTNMQKSGLVDTMWDLIVNSIGAIIVSLSGYFYVKENKQSLFTRMLQKFSSKNQTLFGSN